jgi:hypothetical protein
MKIFFHALYFAMIFKFCRASFSIGSLFKKMKSSHSQNPKFDIVKDETVYSRWRSVIKRDVKFPSGQMVSFDIVSQGASSVIVFIWDTKTNTTTLLREYHPGIDRVMYGLVAGKYEPEKHSSPLVGAQFELEEEANVRSARWIKLLHSLDDSSDECCSVPVEKYSDNAFYPFLVIDCEPVTNPRPLDDEEFIIVEKNISLKQVMDMIQTGQLNVNSSYTSLLAIRKLKELGLLPEEDANIL